MSTVWADEGDIWIGDVPPSPAGAAYLNFPGGVLIVDPLDPARPALCISDPDGAREPVIALYGLRAWDQIEAFTRESGLSVESVGTGWALDTACRLAVVRWLADSSPDPLAESLLVLEEAALVGRLSHVLDQTPPPERAGVVALELVEAALAGNRIGPPAATELALELLGAMVERFDDGIDDDDEHLFGVAEVVDDARDLISRWKERAGAEVDSSELGHVPADWTQPSVLTPIAAGLAMDEAEPAAEEIWRTCSTDWDLVPRGAFDPAEDAIRWRTERRVDGAEELVVRVASGWKAEGGFVARLHSPTSSEIVTEVPLQLREGFWTGRAPTHGGELDLAECWVDVTSADRQRAARRGPARIAATARRWSARGVTRLRFGLASGALVDSTAPMAEAVGALERARMEYARLRYEDARRCHLELGLLIRHALRIQGELHETDDLDVELTAEGRALDPAGGLDRIDMDHPGWQLAVAEQALLVPR